MNAADLSRLLEYRVWARERVLSAAEGLTVPDYTRPLVSSFPSVRDTLVHILSADLIWASRLGGVSPDGHLHPGDFPDVSALRARWGQVDKGLLTAVANLDPDQPISYRTTAGSEYRQPASQIVQHLGNHQTYHLGQVATLLRQLGAGSPATDLIVFDRSGGTLARG